MDENGDEDGGRDENAALAADRRLTATMREITVLRRHLISRFGDGTVGSSSGSMSGGVGGGSSTGGSARAAAPYALQDSAATPVHPVRAVLRALDRAEEEAESDMVLLIERRSSAPASEATDLRPTPSPNPKPNLPRRPSSSSSRPSPSRSAPSPSGLRGRIWRYLPAPHAVDVRSLAALRILLATFFLVDLRFRLIDGRASLSWYASDWYPTNVDGGNEDDDSSRYLPPIFHIDDYDHSGSALDMMWCHGGTPRDAEALFVLTASLAALFGVGLFLGGTVPALLWACLVSMQCRTPDVDYNDGSDALASNLVLWCAVLPGVNRVWSVDAALRRGRRSRRRGCGADAAASDHRPPTLRRRSATLTGAAALGVSVQVSLVYLGIVTHRWNGTMWWIPDLRAVYLALSVPRYNREAVSACIQLFPSLSRIMTLGATFFEVVCPLWAFLCPYDVVESDDGEGGGGTRLISRSRRWIPALLVAQFHLVLWACIRIPTFQWICALEQVIWIPGSAWDSLAERWDARFGGGRGRGKIDTVGPEERRDGDDVAMNDDENFDDDDRGPGPLSSVVRRVLGWALLLTMLVTFAETKGWPIDLDAYVGLSHLTYVSDALHFSQYWNIFGPDAPDTGNVLVWTGVYSRDDDDEEGGGDGDREGGEGEYPDDEDGGDDNGRQRKDVLAAIRTHDWSERTDISSGQYLYRLSHTPTNMSAQFSHWRWESVVMEQIEYVQDNSDDRVMVRLENLCLHVCRWGNRELRRLGNDADEDDNDHDGSSGKVTSRRIDSIHMEYQGVLVRPMDVRGRYSRYYDMDTYLQVECD